MTKWSQINAWLHYRKTSVTKHGVHSPFVFTLATKVFPGPKNSDPEEHPAEDYRTELIMSNRVIDVQDFGTGISGPRKVAAIAKHSAKSPKEGQLLHRIVKHFGPKKMLELGTSLGITTIYEATATPFEKFITLEGCPNTASLAEEIFRKENLHVEVRTGEFGTTLKNALDSLENVDYVFFDGNHREEATLDYFETCLPYANNDSVFVFDDIHWSPEMENAWEKIKTDPRVRLSIDVFHFGLVFFREEQMEKEDFVLRY
ncbi:MAG TPA: class I SAM-dependent methyltransferase [Bacteroidia bacterium]|nr:class I SAM-dependent methyltransferase [Bacteroidia bacterium]